MGVHGQPGVTLTYSTLNAAHELGNHHNIIFKALVLDCNSGPCEVSIAQLAWSEGRHFTR
jgi:hypothetical protein